MPLPDEFWQSSGTTSAEVRSPAAKGTGTTQFKGTVALGLAQNNKEGHPEHYHRSTKRADLKRWFDEGCPLFVMFSYRTDENGKPKRGARQSYSLTDCQWVSPDILLIVRADEEHWHVVEDDAKE